MKKLFTIIILIFLLCFTFSCQQGEEVAEEPVVDIAAEKAALEEAFWISQKAGATKDIELLLSVIADDVVYKGGKEGLREWYSNFFTAGRYWKNSTIDKIEISKSGDLGYIAFRWEYFRDEEGETSTGTSSNTGVWEKQTDGSWKLVAF